MLLGTKFGVVLAGVVDTGVEDVVGTDVGTVGGAGGGTGGIPPPPPTPPWALEGWRPAPIPWPAKVPG